MPPNEASVEEHAQGPLQSWKQSALIRFLLFFCLGLLFYFSLADKLVPPVYDILPNSASPETILAPKQIENAIETEKAKEDAARRVAPVYRSVPARNLELTETAFDKMRMINADAEMKPEEKQNYYRSIFPSIYQDFRQRMLAGFGQEGPYGGTLAAEIGKQMNDQQYKMAEEIFFKLPRLTQDDLSAMETVVRDIVNKLMNEQIADAQTARAKVTELVNSSTLAKNTTREAAQEIARFAITPNRFYDAEGTDEARAQARETTKPVYINKGEVLVGKGEMISDAIFQRLKAADVLKNKTNYMPPLGLALLSSLFVLILYMYVRHSRQPVRTSNAQLIMLVLAFILNIVGMRIVALGENLEYPFIGYLAPVSMGAMLIVILLEERLAIVSSVIYSVMASIIFNTAPNQLFDFRFGLVSLTMCFAAVLALQRAGQRSAILRAGIMVSLFAALAIAALIFLDNDYNARTVIVSLSFGLASGLVTAVLVLGLMPFFETAFGILSPLKLVELSNPNLPLLRKLLTETPGTYHHSIMVGNLSETAAEAIGADGLLCRVGSYYHDIGKTKRPGYFIENQMNMENPHDHIEPELSKAIIIAHPRDGVEMLKDHKIPKPIRDIAEQHHGTTLLKYFYHKAKQQAGDPANPVSEEDYRYPGPKAQCKEAAIVGIADCVEAAVRSLRHPTVGEIDTMVRKIIKDRLDDGQFNECDLTIRELETVGTALKETLMGIFHSRIEYPADQAAGKPAGDGMTKPAEEHSRGEG